MLLMCRSRAFCALRTLPLRNIRLRTIASVKDTDALAYERISPIDHILQRPDSYIGSTTLSEKVAYWLFDDSRCKMENVKCTYSPGLLNIFDEIVVNAADNKRRDYSGMTKLTVTIDRVKNAITVENNGLGIPVDFHPVEKMYVPTLIFGNLLTSSNYNDSIGKTVGGRNGLGAKVCNIYSTEFLLETWSASRSLIFKQKWRNNMQVCEDPVIESSSVIEDMTRITFKPDLKRFGLSSLDEEMIRVLKRRVLDVSATLPGVQVIFDGMNMTHKVKNFHDYIRLFANDVMLATSSSKWQIGMAKSEYVYQQISFVNNVLTSKGGTHTDYIVNQIVASIRKHIHERFNGKDVKPILIKNKIFLFINSTIENPSFDSQTKDLLTNKIKDFGSINLDKKSIVQWATRTGIIADLVTAVDVKRKLTRQRVDYRTLPKKLEDARYAGTARYQECTLIVTEGDSAKALAVAGLEVLGRDKFGIFPVRGKLSNVSGLSFKESCENSEIDGLVKILGLSNFSANEQIVGSTGLRYGRVMILADQDEDGSHIKGLFLNLFMQFWPTLLKSGFLCSFRTPLLKVLSDSGILSFYSMAEYNQWESANKRGSQYTVKYYKGLGTSTAAEAKEYFSNLEKHTTVFTYKSDEDLKCIRLAFDKDSADHRKKWISQQSPTFPDDANYDHKSSTTISDFVNHELITYSLLDLRRSIPSAIDGLKPSQRKVLHTLFNITDSKKERKVNQLAATVSMNQAYHHGEESLTNTIVRMAQNYVGSNNLPYLNGIGQFGTRHEGGNDSASSRYIYTELSRSTRLLFPSDDDVLLDYLIEERQIVEPKFYIPIIPTVLLNGVEGIGTGWATRVLPCNVFTLIENVRRAIQGQPLLEMMPFFRGYRGSISRIGANCIETTGILEKDTMDGRRIKITELPISMATNAYKTRVLLPLLNEGYIRDLKELHTETSVLFNLILKKEEKKSDLEQKFKLSAKLSTNSMVLFNADGSLTRYGTVEDIFLNFFAVRRQYYQRRLKIIQANFLNKCVYIENQLRFISSVLNGSFDMKAYKSSDELIAVLANQEYHSDPFSKDSNRSYDYLSSIPIYRINSSEVTRLENKLRIKRASLDQVNYMKWENTWLSDLENLEKSVGNSITQ